MPRSCVYRLHQRARVIRNRSSVVKNVRQAAFRPYWTGRREYQPSPISEWDGHWSKLTGVWDKSNLCDCSCFMCAWPYYERVAQKREDQIRLEEW